jgi:two-component system sensor histidine kinase PhoQ
VQSISSRLLIGTAIVLTIFVVLTGLSISYSVHKRAETALFDRLQGLIYGILGAAEIDNNQNLIINEFELPDSRLNVTTAGLYAEIIGDNGQTLWQSKSTTSLVPPVSNSAIGDWVFERATQSDTSDVHTMQLATVWELDSGAELPFVVHVVADAQLLTGELRRFDRTLWVSLLASAVLLLLLQLWILSHSLKPLKHIGDELTEIEQGTRQKLNEAIPKELSPLASSINLLLQSEHNRHQQYRHLLDDLAHSLKTPLSVLRNMKSDNPTIDEQTGQMQTTIERYLQRAAMRTPQYLSKPVSPTAVINKLSNTLIKVHADKQTQFDIQIDNSFMVRVAEVDLYEILGNVLDNACKFGASIVLLHSDTQRMQLVVDDDGPGFPDSQRASLTDRGTRADTAIEGQGLGLAASRELMQSYGGELSLDTSPQGGARVVLQFPG